MKSLIARLSALALATLAATSLTSCYYYDYCPPVPVAAGYCPPPVVVAPRPVVVAPAPVCNPWNSGWGGGGWGSVAWNSAPYGGGFCNPYPRYVGGFGGFYGGGFNRGYCR